MKNLIIDTVENGFIVKEHNCNGNLLFKKWVFETPDSLAAFVQDWSKHNLLTFTSEENDNTN